MSKENKSRTGAYILGGATLVTAGIVFHSYMTAPADNSLENPLYTQTTVDGTVGITNENDSSWFYVASKDITVPCDSVAADSVDAKVAASELGATAFSNSIKKSIENAIAKNKKGGNGGNTPYVPPANNKTDDNASFSVEDFMSPFDGDLYMTLQRNDTLLYIPDSAIYVPFAVELVAQGWEEYVVAPPVDTKKSTQKYGVKFKNSMFEKPAYQRGNKQD